MDNLARKLIIPHIQRYLKPPADFFSRISDDDLRYEIEKLKLDYTEHDRSLDKFFVNSSIQGYECIKLERTPEDQNGFVRVCMFSDYFDPGFVERLTYKIGDYQIDF